MRWNLCAVWMLPCIVAIVAPNLAPAQTSGDSLTVLPGDALVEPGRLLPHRATWRVTRRYPGGGHTVQGLWTDTWARSTDAGRPVFLFRQLFVDTAGAVLYDAETVFDAATFRASRSTQRMPPNGSWVTYRYAEGSASGTLRSSGSSEPREFEVVFDEPVWEPLAPVSVLVPLERMEGGAVLRFPIWNQTGSDDDVTWSEVRVDSVGTAVVTGGRTVEVRYLTVVVAAAPNTVTSLRQTPDAPYYWWFAVERPGLTREWTLVNWESFAPPDRSASPEDPERQSATRPGRRAAG